MKKLLCLFGALVLVFASVGFAFADSTSFDTTNVDGLFASEVFQESDNVIAQVAYYYAPEDDHNVAIFDFLYDLKVPFGSVITLPSDAEAAYSAGLINFVESFELVGDHYVLTIVDSSDYTYEDFESDAGEDTSFQITLTDTSAAHTKITNSDNDYFSVDASVRIAPYFAGTDYEFEDLNTSDPVEIDLNNLSSSINSFKALIKASDGFVIDPESLGDDDLYAGYVDNFDFDLSSMALDSSFEISDPSSGSQNGVIESTGSVFSTAIGFVSTVVQTITSNPLLLIFAIVSLVGLGIGMTKRIMNL